MQHWELIVAWSVVMAGPCSGLQPLAPGLHPGATQLLMITHTFARPP
jgi:hypothetical protein